MVHARMPSSTVPGAPAKATFGYTFPAIRGIQAGREYYVSMCPLRLIPKIFLFNEEELVPELRAQRVLNKSRIPEIARYLLDNLETYTLSALTVSIDGQARFIPSSAQDSPLLGSLQVSLDTRFVVNDGQHRRAAIEWAIRENPELADESIAVVFFVDTGLSRCQQMFADLNRHAIRPSTSLGVLYDQRDSSGRVVKQWILNDPMFREITEMERSTLSKRSRKLFTLSALYQASSHLISTFGEPDETRATEQLREFWAEVAKQFPAWNQVALGQLTSAEVRSEQLHSHGIVLHALGRAGAVLLRSDPTQWRCRLEKLALIDWSRQNQVLWEGRAMVGGKVSKSGTQVTLVTNIIKNFLGLELTAEEQRLEDALHRVANV